ncbi:MAG: hypothetical protein ACTFAL_15650 [Candidatus Electronema sp. V4]|uniref:hypothetical protein n=1 Tax=Candidatus Electronema sp. V4 TaxID=3454756 RepID=UPI0040559046
MIINELLQMKYDTQKRQDEEVGYDLKRYMEITHRNVQKIAAAYGLKLKYRTPGEVKTASAES